MDKLVVLGEEVDKLVVLVVALVLVAVVAGLVDVIDAVAANWHVASPQLDEMKKFVGCRKVPPPV